MKSPTPLPISPSSFSPASANMLRNALGENATEAFGESSSVSIGKPKREPANEILSDPDNPDSDCDVPLPVPVPPSSSNASGKIMTLAEKSSEFLRLCARAESLVSHCESKQFLQRCKIIKDIISSWERNIEVAVVPNTSGGECVPTDIEKDDISLCLDGPHIQESTNPDANKDFLNHKNSIDSTPSDGDSFLSSLGDDSSNSECSSADSDDFWNANVIQEPTEKKTENDKSSLCHICSKMFVNRDRLKIHLRTHSGEKPYECQICNRKYRQSGSLTTHMRTHTGEKPYGCTLCDKKFTRGTDLRAHYLFHSDEKPYECTICARKCKYKTDLKKHMRIHTGEKPYECTMCDMSFIQKHNLEGHVRSRHTGEKPFECAQCGKKFCRKDQVRIHLKNCGTKAKDGKKRVRGPGTGSPQECYICKLKFSSNYSLEKHFGESHTGQKPYQCSVCLKKISCPSGFRIHLRTHTGERSFECSVCDKRFTTNVNLKTHLRTHTGEKPFECPVCNKRFNQSCELKAHARVHTGEKPFKCKVCNKNFAQGSTLRKHLQTHEAK